MATIDGSIQLVKVVTDAELRQNGGSFVVAGRMAQPIQGFDTLTKRASGGNAIPVYVVSDAQIANGTFRLKGGSALPMADIDVVAAGVKTIQGAAIPVYVVSGSLGAGGAAVPDAPANLIATAISGSQVDLSWDAVTGATGYKIERSTNGVDFTEIQDQAGTTYSNTGLSGVLTFTYRVIAYNAVGDGAASSTAAVEYYQRILATQAANLIALWRQNETSGTVADNAEGTAARDGAYTGVDLNNAAFTNGDPTPFYDGTNDFLDIYNTSLAAAFNGDVFTILYYIKLPAAAWVDGTARYATIFRGATSANQIYMLKDTTNNRFGFLRTANNLSKLVYATGLSSTDWIQVAMTCDTVADELKMYANRAQVGVTQTGLSAWTSAGSLTSVQTLVGALTQTPTSVFHGNISNFTIWAGKALTLAEIQSL